MVGSGVGVMGVSIGVVGVLVSVFGVETGIIADFMVAGSTLTRQVASTPTKPRLNTRFESVPKNPISCRSIVND